MTHNSKTTCKNAFSERTYQHAMLYIPEGTWGETVYDGDWYMFNNIRETTMKTNDLSPSRAYRLMDTHTFGYAVYDGTNDEVKIEKAFYSIDEQDLNNCWQIITQAGKRYLYNLGAKKYATISADGRIMLTANKTAIEVKEGDGGIILGEDTNHQWGFVKIDSPLDVTGIIPQTSITEKTANSYYSLDGQCTHSPRKGMNIVRMSDGSIKKVVIK